jgi:predicted Zn-dependent protease
MVVVLPVLFLSLLAAGFAARKVLDARRTGQLIAWADVAMASGDYENAASNYARALARRPQDVALADKCGDALYQASAARPKALFEARSVWQQALSVNSEDLPTLRRLLSLDADLAEVGPSDAVFTDLGQVAATVATLVPDDEQACTLRMIAPLGAWATGHTKSDAGTSSSDRDSDIAHLADLLDQNPANGTALRYYTLALTRQARELRGTEAGDSKVDRLLNQAETRLRAALQSPHADANSFYRTAQGLMMIAQARSPFDGATPSPSTQLVDPVVAKLVDLARDACDKAVALTNPKDHDFLPCRVLRSKIAVAQGERDIAEAALRDAIARRPDGISALIALAELLNASDPEAAIAILDEAQAATSVEPGARALEFQASKVQASVLQAAICVNSASVAENPDIRAVRISRAQTACDRALADAAGNPVALKASARLRLLQGRYVDAIQTADLAIPKTESSGGPEDPDLSHIKAAAFWSLHEPQEALDELNAALAANSALLPHRLLRAQILLAQGRIGEAADQAVLLEQQARNDPQVVQLLLDVQRAQAKADPSPEQEAKTNHDYQQLPESSDAQRRQKARQAVVMGDFKEAARLLDKDRDINSIPDAIELADVLSTDHQTARAAAVIDGALGAHPKDSRLLYAKKILEGATADELKQYAQELSLAQPDSLAADLEMARSALAQKNPAQARQALDRAKAIKPDDIDLLDLDFHCDLLEQQWDAAQRCVDKLVAANYDQTNGLHYQFELAMARQDVPTATAIANTLTSRFEKFSQSWLALGSALQAGGKPVEARDAFQHAWYLEPTNLPAIKALATCCLATGRDSEAGSWIQQGRSIAPNDADFLKLDHQRRMDLITSCTKASSPQWDQVEQLLTEAKTASPADPLWDATEARMWWARGNAAKAAPFMHKAILLAEAPDSVTAIAPDAHTQLRAMIREELMMLLAANDLVGVAAESKRIIGRYGDADAASAWAHLAMAIRLHRLSATDPQAGTELAAGLNAARAANDVTCATEIVGKSAAEIGPAQAMDRIAGYGSAAIHSANPFDQDIRWDVLRARLLEARGDSFAAAAAMDVLMSNLQKLSPDEQISMLRLAARIYDQSQPVPQIDKARDAYLALLARAPDDVAALNNLACLLLDQATPPQPQQALVYSQRAFDQMSRDGDFNPQIADTHGWALANNGQIPKAIELLEKAVQQMPTAQTHDHLAEAYLLAGEPTHAEPHLAAALELLRAAEHNGQPDPPLRQRLETAQRRIGQISSK